MKKLLLTTAFALPFAITAQVTVASENFDSYANSDSLTIVGASNGWESWSGGSGTTEEGYVSTSFSNSGSNSGKFSNTDPADAFSGSDMVMKWANVTTGMIEIEFNVYLDSLSGIAGGYMGIGDEGINTASGTQPNYIWFLGANIVFNDANDFLLGDLGYDAWHNVRIVIDMDNGVSDFYVDAMNVGQLTNTFATTGLGALDFWATSNDGAGGYIPGQYYLDDISVMDITNVVGLEENAITSSIYPNPASDILTIESNQDIENIAIISLDGKVVLNESVNGMTTQVNVSSLISGSYLIELTSVNGTIVKNTFVKK